MYGHLIELVANNDVKLTEYGFVDFLNVSVGL